MSNPQTMELNSIPSEYIYFKPKDIARMSISIASDINMTDPDSDKELTGILLQNKDFLKKFTHICTLLNNCGKDVAIFLDS
jgi:hypothetical protein